MAERFLRPARIHAVFQLWLLSVSVAAVVGTAYLAFVPEDASPHT